MVNEGKVGPMKRTTKMVVVGVAVVVLVVFFFLAPVVWTNIVPCLKTHEQGK